METPTRNIILRTENLEIGYRKKKRETVIASGINIEVKSGELVGVIGRNGVGKSTLLRSLSGVQEPLKGKVLLNGKDRAGLSSRELAHHISLVLTGQQLSKNLSVAELVALGRQPYTNWIGTLTAQDLKMVQQALAWVGITELQRQKCFELSDGQLQKVLIARALAQDTSLMILDEPTSHLDLYHKAQVLKLLKQLTQHTQKSIVFATHEINLALQLCDRLILMLPGKIIQDSPQHLLQKGVFEEIFPKDLISFDAASESFRIKT